ncbi:MAG TPA: hypothetical protein VIY27_10910, partial [Myxococcota bacterium]
LFAREARWLGEDGPTDPAWPAALGAPAEDAAFAWLRNERQAFAWLNTEAAARAATDARAILAGAPPEVVREVHDKVFAHRACEEQGLVPRALRGLIAVFDAHELESEGEAVERIQGCLNAWPEWTRGAFTLKPRLGGSGRGRVAGRDGRADTRELRDALPRLARQGGALLEPWLNRQRDLSVQLYIAPDGNLTLLGTLEQQVSGSGVYRGHSGALDYKARVTSGSAHEDAILEAAVEIARAAHARGFCGPCGVDAFSFEGPEGLVLRPVVEFNARFTAGTVLLGLLHRVRERAAEPLAIAAGQRRAFRFALDASAEAGDAPERMRLSLAAEGESLQPTLWIAHTPDGQMDA